MHDMLHPALAWLLRTHFAIHVGKVDADAAAVAAVVAVARAVVSGAADEARPSVVAAAAAAAGRSGVAAESGPDFAAEPADAIENLILMSSLVPI